jgi:hypothetical protein
MSVADDPRKMLQLADEIRQPPREQKVRQLPDKVTSTDMLPAIKELLETKFGDRGSVLDRAVTFRDLAGIGNLQLGSGGGVIPGGTGSGGGGDGGFIPVPSSPDDMSDTIPPAPTNLQVFATALRTLLQYDPPPDFVAFTEIWSNGVNNLGTAVRVGTAGRGVYLWADNLNATGSGRYYWVRFVNRSYPFLVGPFNSTAGTYGKTGVINGVDLGDLIVEAHNLANGAVTRQKVDFEIGGANQVLNSGFEADSDNNGTADSWRSYNTGSGTTTLTLTTPSRSGNAQRVAYAGADGKVGLATNIAQAWQQNKKYVISFYAYGSGGAIGSVPAPIWANQPASMDATLAPVLTDTLQRYAYVVAWADIVEPAALLQIGIQAFIGANGSLTFDDVQVEEGDFLTSYAPRPGEIKPGSITATEIADNAITTPKLVAGAVVAGKIAAGAVQADSIAAGAVTAAKVVISAKSLNLDSSFSAGLAMWPNFVYRGVTSNSAQFPAGCGAAYGATFKGRDDPCLTEQTVKAGEVYRITGWQHAGSSANPGHIAYNRGGARVNGFIVYWLQDAPGTLVTAHPLDLVTGPSDNAWHYLDMNVTAPVGAVAMRVGPWNDQDPAGTQIGFFADLNWEKAVDALLIVDGSIKAEKLSANAIAVGSAAIENGAIANAMLGNAIIDTAKIIDGAILSAKIADGQITNAKIGDAAITNAKIADAQITGAKIGLATITSANILDASITNAKIGNIITSANFNGVIDSIGDIQNVGTLGWALSKRGGFVASTAYIRGDIQASSVQASISISAPTINGGSINGTTGTFSGSLTADAVNAVSSINLAGNSVTVPAYGNFTGALQSPVNGGYTKIPFAQGDPTVNVPTGSVVLVMTVKFNPGILPGGDSGGGGNIPPRYQLRRNGTAIYGFDSPANAYSDADTYMDSAPGNAVYTLWVAGGSANATPTTTKATLLALGAKK